MIFLDSGGLKGIGIGEPRSLSGNSKPPCNPKTRPPALHPCPDGILSKCPRRTTSDHLIPPHNGISPSPPPPGRNSIEMFSPYDLIPPHNGISPSPPAPYGFNRFLELHLDFPGFCMNPHPEQLSVSHTPDSLIFFARKQYRHTFTIQQNWSCRRPNVLARFFCRRQQDSFCFDPYTRRITLSP